MYHRNWVDIKFPLSHSECNIDRNFDQSDARDKDHITFQLTIYPFVDCDTPIKGSNLQDFSFWAANNFKHTELNIRRQFTFFLINQMHCAINERRKKKLWRIMKPETVQLVS